MISSSSSSVSASWALVFDQAYEGVQVVVQGSEIAREVLLALGLVRSLGVVSGERHGHAVYESIEREEVGVLEREAGAVEQKDQGRACASLCGRGQLDGEKLERHVTRQPGFLSVVLLKEA